MKIDMNNPIKNLPEISQEDFFFNSQDKLNRSISNFIRLKKIGMKSKGEGKIIYLFGNEIFLLSDRDIKRMKRKGIRI